MKTPDKISIQAFVSQATDSETLIVDVRSFAEYAHAHIKGAINIPLNDILANSQDQFALTRFIDNKKNIIFVCKSGHRAQQAAEHVANHDELAVTWCACDIEVCETNNIAVVKNSNRISLERQVQMTAGLMILIGTILGAWVNQWFYILPGFIGAGLTYAGLSNTCGLALILAKMPWNKA